MANCFQGKRVLITGGANGIGRAIVQKFWEAKATVFVIDKDGHALEKLETEFPGVCTTVLNLGDPTVLKTAILPMLPLHHLVNNVGMLSSTPDFLEMSMEDVDTHFDVNFKVAFSLSQIFAKGVIDFQLGGGTIVNISSISDKLWVPGFTIYCCTKASLSMLSKCMAGELGKYNIRSNAVRPGAVDTIFGRTVHASASEETNQIHRAILARRPMQTQLEAKNVADLVIFLSGPESEAITGQEIALDGGISFT